MKQKILRAKLIPVMCTAVLVATAPAGMVSASNAGVNNLVGSGSTGVNNLVGGSAQTDDVVSDNTADVEEETPVVETPSVETTDTEETASTAGTTEVKQASADDILAACAAYYTILSKEADSIRTFEQHLADTEYEGSITSARQVAVTDITGDGMPELLYMVSDDKYFATSTLHVYTYHDSKAAEVFKEDYAGEVGGGGYYEIFRTEENGPMYIYYSVGDESWTDQFDRYELNEDGKLISTWMLKDDVQIGDNGETTHTILEDKTELTKDEYDLKVKSLLENGYDLLLFNRYYPQENVYAGFDKLKNGAVSVDEALEALGSGKIPVPVQKETESEAESAPETANTVSEGTITSTVTYPEATDAVDDDAAYQEDVQEEEPAQTDVVDDNVSTSSGGMYFSDSDSRYLSEADIAGFSYEDIRHACNEIYARHGYRFSNPDILAQFQQYSWYNGYEPDMQTVWDSMNSIEHANVEFLANYL